MRRLIKRSARSLLRVSDALPGAYARRRLVEQWIYRRRPQVHDLPPIFHYWSNAWLRPLFQSMGFSDPEDFFLRETLRQAAASPGRALTLASLGSGNCDMEVRLATRLGEAGIGFTLQCIDLNPVMLERGRDLARRSEVADHLDFVQGDFNRWRPGREFDVVLANQCLHHVVELENLFDAIHTAIGDNGVLLTSDMIGRNGHQRWPEALALLEPLWEELPPEYRYDHTACVRRKRFEDRDCSLGSFEGIRAQDVLPLLCERFEFDLFVPFANIVLVFVERAYGPNFDPDNPWDREFIDRVQRVDAEAIAGGRITPTQMLAALRRNAPQPRIAPPGLTPQACIRRP